MKSLRFGQTTLAFALLAARLFALPGHTWVSGTGSDANSGTRTSPFATFQNAVTNTAAGGIVSVLDPGDFGAVYITKAITIDGGGVGGTIIGGAPYMAGITVSAGTSDTVILKHLTVNVVGTTADVINIYSAGQVIIEDCHLENTVSSVLYVVPSAATNVVVRRTTMTGGVYGFYSSGNFTASLSAVTISGTTGAAVVLIGPGLVEISDSVITQNPVGLTNDGKGAINVANSVLSYNTTDVTKGSTVLLSNNNTFFANNGTGGSVGTSSLRPSIPNNGDRPKNPAGQDKR